MNNYIQVKAAGSPSPPEWVEPSDWIDINTVADNEILLLVTEGTGIGFVVKVGTGEPSRLTGVTAQLNQD